MIAAVLVDGEQRIEVDYDSPLWRATLEWARFHGIDPNVVPAGSEVIRDAANRRLIFDEFVFDVDCNPVVEGDEPVLIRRVDQGEAPPLPFPS